MIFNPNAIITVEDIQGLQCLLIDNAFLNPDELRLYAKESLNTETISKNIMGYEIHPTDIEDKLSTYKNELAEIIETHIGTSICNFFNINASEVSLKAFKGPYFNCIGVNKLPVFTPHVDFGHISTFAYLNTPETCAGGTRVYRHIPTNTINVVQKGSPSLQWMQQKPLDKPLVESTDEWECIKFFEMKYNRLIAFNSSAIHKIDLTGGNFSMDFDKARLCLNCFYFYIGPDGKMVTRNTVN